VVGVIHVYSIVFSEDALPSRPNGNYCVGSDLGSFLGVMATTAPILVTYRLQVTLSLRSDNFA
jgi:hypothetical protein